MSFNRHLHNGTISSCVDHRADNNACGHFSFFLEEVSKQRTLRHVRSMQVTLFIQVLMFRPSCHIGRRNQCLSTRIMKNGSWLFSYEISELEALAVTLPSADRDIELDWILDSGASCHFCNDSLKFISMKKCNISISTAKKGENLQAIGIGYCMITTQTATGEKVKLICKDALYVPEARRNLLSSQDPVFPPGIYNCRKDKTSVEHSIPIIAIWYCLSCSDVC